MHINYFSILNKKYGSNDYLFKLFIQVIKLLLNFRRQKDTNKNLNNSGRPEIH
jgi:hypothetical protein